jgi:rhamnose transport system permease protein
MLAKEGLPVAVAALFACALGAALGAINGTLTSYMRIPSIVVTLAAMIGLRDALRWITQGAWVQDLPEGFQWFGLSPSAYATLTIGFTTALTGAMAWALRHFPAGRAVYATGSNAAAARLAGIRPTLVKCSVFILTGAFTGCAAVLNSVRFNQIPTNAGLGLELKVIAAVVVGGAAITGGRGSIAGTLLGVILLGLIGPALTFLGVNAYWEKAIQGAIILAALCIDVLGNSAARKRMSHALS